MLFEVFCDIVALFVGSERIVEQTYLALNRIIQGRI